MSTAIPTHEALISALEVAYNENFPSSDRLREYGISPVVWSEGGEWPAFNEMFCPIAGLKDLPLPDGDFVPVTSPDNIADIVTRAFDIGSSANLSMDCGAGKSTKLVLNMHRLRLTYSTIVVEPSVVVARSLAKYVSTISDGVTIRTGLSGDRNRTISYVSAGELLAYLLLGGSLTDDLVLLDEAHAVTSVYRAIREIVRRLDVKFVQMTASVGSGVRPTRAARIKKVATLDTTVSNKIAESAGRAAVVGVVDNGTYALSANMLIGATTDLSVVYDTGLRPDPILTKDKLTLGERPATELEITQMAGRVGRVAGNTGYVFYNDQAKATPDKRTRLYDVVYETLMAVAGCPSAYTLDKAIKAYKTGFISRPRPDSVGSNSSSNVLSSDEEIHSAKRMVLPDIASMNLDSKPSRPKIREKTRHSHRRRRSSRSDHSQDETSDAILTSTVIRSLAQDAVDHIYDRGQVPIPKSQSRSMLIGCMQKLDQLLNRGGIILGGYFPIEDTGLSAIDKEDARQVLAKRMVASYTQTEVHAVMSLWNRVSDTAINGVINPHIFTQFRDYFLGYEKFMNSEAFRREY